MIKKNHINLSKMKQKVYTCYDESALPNVDGKNIFQQQVMFRFYRSLKNYTPFFIFIEENGNVLVSLLGVVIKEKNIYPSFLASRCLIIGKAEFFSDNITELSAYKLLLKEIDNEFRRKCLFIEFRFPEKNEELNAVFRENNYAYSPWYNVKNNLNEDYISPAKKRQIKSGFKNGASIIEATTEAQVKAFYAILKQLYSNIKKPLPPIEFFTRFLHDFCEKGKGVYLLIDFQGKIIGGIMCLFENNETIYEWYVGSNHNEYKNLYPGVLSVYAAIDYGRKNGFRCFDFLGAGQQNTAYTVRDFKLTFGGNLEETTRWQKVNFRVLYKMALFANRFLMQIKN